MASFKRFACPSQQDSWSIRKFFGSLLDLICNFLFFVALTAFVCMILTWACNDFDRTKANVFGYMVNPVLSDSMEPTIMTGDILISKRVKFEDVEVGDVIIYKHMLEDGKVISILHRVVEKYDGYLITKGDNNPTNDPWEVYPEDVRFKAMTEWGSFRWPFGA